MAAVATTDGVDAFVDFISRAAALDDDPRNRTYDGGVLVKRTAKTLVAAIVEGPVEVLPEHFDRTAYRGHLRTIWDPASTRYTVVDALKIMLLDWMDAPEGAAILKADVVGVLGCGPGRWLAILATSTKAAAMQRFALAAPGNYAVPALRGEWAVDPGVAAVDLDRAMARMIERFGPAVARPDTIAYCLARAAIEGPR